MKYSIVDVKQSETELSFCAVVDDPLQKDVVFVFEDVQFIENDEGALEIGVNMSKLIPGAGIRGAEAMDDKEVAFMQDLLTEMINDFITGAVDRAETSET